jgi:hypothetical protein
MPLVVTLAAPSQLLGGLWLRCVTASTSVLRSRSSVQRIGDPRCREGLNKFDSVEDLEAGLRGYIRYYNARAHARAPELTALSSTFKDC